MPRSAKELGSVMWSDNTGWGVSGWVAMGVMMLVVWGALALLVVAPLRDRWGTRGEDRSRPMPVRPEDLLAERFARGEIDADEFDRDRRVLAGTAAGRAPRS